MRALTGCVQSRHDRDSAIMCGAHHWHVATRASHRSWRRGHGV